MVAAQLSEANTGLRVDEGATRLVFHSDQAEISLVVNSSRGEAITARMEFELVDELNRAVTRFVRDVTLRQGSNTVKFEFALERSAYVLWRRLRYQIVANSATDHSRYSTAGTVSLSQVASDLFALKLIKPVAASEGSRCLFRVRAEHPVSMRPVEGVSLRAELAFDGLTPPLSRSGVTDSDGYAVFEFDLPTGLTSDGEIKVTGTRAGLSADVEDTINVDRATRTLISTDKNIYQPGQVLHVRALVLDPLKHAVKGSEATLKILDPEDTIVHRAALKTSRFGVASDDWAIPSNVRLGNYDISIDYDDSDERRVYAFRRKVRISRYDLPNFGVNVKTDHGFYLPGQNAEVEVRGEYFFGQSLTRARVRLVHETDREWNYREQRWEIRESEIYYGDLDPSGRFVASVDLASEHKGLAEQDYKRFKDVSYTAYVTDPTSNRTEQRRFDVRVTKEPIHVYVIDDGYRVRNEYCFVSTSYADGTPAQCDVDVSQELSGESAGVGIIRLRHLRTVKTNRYGVARVVALAISGAENKPAQGSLLNGANLVFSARDGEGRLGHASRTDQYSSTGSIRVETNKALYKAGDPVDIRVTASGRVSTLFVDVVQRWKVVHSRTISLVDGHGRLTLPYEPAFKDELTIAVYGYEESGDLNIGNRVVLFPGNRDLKIAIDMSQPKYRPGEPATADFHVQTGDGKAAESGLGVAVIDRAVEERARADGEFGGRYDFAATFNRMWGYDEQIAGMTINDLDALDMSKPIPPDLQLVAEILLLRRGYWLEERSTSIGSPKHEFGHILGSQLKPVTDALKSRYNRTKEYPTNAAMLARELADFGLDFAGMRDPWGLPYVPSFSVSRDFDVLKLVSAGPDKRVGTRDDFPVVAMSWPYFRATGEALDRAVQRYHKRTNSFIRDRQSLRRELFRDAINIDALRDRWGKPYMFEFGVRANLFTVEVKSGGSDRRFIEKPHPTAATSFTVWSSKIDYFAETRAKIEAALASYFMETKRFPQEEAALKEALSRASIDWENLRDPWGNRYYAAFKTESRYRDRVRIMSFAQYKEQPRRLTEITAVTQHINVIHLRSGGQDRKEGTTDDFEAATFSRVVSEQTSLDASPVRVASSPTLTGVTGAIGGVIADANGAVIARATVKATDKRSTLEYEGRTSDNGRYLLANLPVGYYEVSFSATGFAPTVITDVPVSSSNTTELSATLIVSATAEVVDVTAAAPAVQTQVSELSVNRPAPIATSLAAVKQSTLTSTPRLREYFPETLVWQPAIETDSSGHARLTFNLADTITTWKMSVIASTEDGEIGTAEKEILAFQPFFIEHDPPRILTEGDEIALPVVLRNYLDKAQAVELEIKPEPWFTLLGSARKRSEVAAGDSSREVFDFRAVAPVNDGKQRVTAIGPEASDAIEKPVTVHPNGQEVTQTTTQVFSDSASIPVIVPDAAIRGSARSELKIYPNLMAHVVESIEAIMKRPYGCAEQTISSAYPSLLLLRSFKSQEEHSSALAQKARRYVALAYEKLVNYRNEDGGFTYWGRGESDPALTAYALRFLSDAREVTAVDEDIIKTAREWLVKHQRPDGSWQPRYARESDRFATASLTAFITRMLASTSTRDEAPATASARRRSLNLLGMRTGEMDEPYLIASYALAAMNCGERTGADRAIEKLLRLAHDEGDASYWALEANTPFYGWGIAGRIEATALAVQALARYDGKSSASVSGGSPSNRSVDELINRGLVFLLRNKDREGVWHSTQATVNVLDSLTAVLGKREPAGTATNSPAEVFVNERRVASIPMPPASRLAEPILTDISRFISTGSSRIQIRRAAGSPQASAQVVESHYEPWPAIADAAKRSSASVGALRFQVSFDKVEAKIADEITCTVQVERVGFRGYGMMLAEIGLPPGADVDRASLELAIKESGWGVEQYDVLPDRLIVYLWPQAGGTRFQFKFRPRFGLVAQTASSFVYDYYNPESRAVVAPTRFTVR